MSKYVRLTKTVNDKGILVKPEDVHKHITNPKIDHYSSTYYYNENHFKDFQQTGSIAGIKDVKTDMIWWDFDAENNTKAAREDSLTLIERLSKFVDPNNLDIFFSGNKGFHVILNLTKELNRQQVENFAKRMAEGLKTFDPSLYDESQLLRIPGTKHNKSNNYKTLLTYGELRTLTKQEMLEKAQKQLSLKEAHPSRFLIDLKEDLFKVEEKPKEVKDLEIELEEEFDLTTKPRMWKSSKWALMQGFFTHGERDTSMMILASTIKGMGYDKTTNKAMCLSALNKSWKRHGTGGYSEDDLDNQLARIYSKEWHGGTYSEKEDLFLQNKAEELGIRELVSTTTVDIKGALRIYKDYAKNISKLTLKTGIKELDDKQRITVGMAFGIVASPGSGKTSIAMTMLHSMSKNGELCIFFSYDMYAPLIVQKIIQRHWTGPEGINEIFKKYESGDEEYVKKVEALITQEYPNVEFCFETGQSIEDIYNTIKETEQKRGKKCRFVVVDYNELVITDVNDPTQSSNKVAQNIRAMAQKEQLCVLSLFQPSKMTGDPSSEIMSYRAAKGGSGIEQSLRIMLGVSRPGYDPNNPQYDKFLNLKVLKNNMGEIFSVDLHWNGYKGEIRTLNPTEKSELRALRDAKEEEKKSKLNSPWDSD